MSSRRYFGDGVDAPAPVVDVAIDSAPPVADAVDAARPFALPITHWPEGATDSRHAILLLHGGGGPHYFADLADYRGYPEALAAAGYHVFMPHLVGCGRCTSEAHDAIAAIVASPGVRADRIGVIGFSAGASRAFSIVASMGADLPKVAAVVALYGSLSDPPPEASAFPPTLVLHGDRDEVIPVTNAHDVEHWLERLGAPVTLRSAGGLDRPIGAVHA